MGENKRERLSKKEGVLESRREKMKDEKREREIEKGRVRKVCFS